MRDQFVKIVDEVTIEANAAVAATEAKNRQNIIDAGGTIRGNSIRNSARHGSTR